MDFKPFLGAINGAGFYEIKGASGASSASTPSLAQISLIGTTAEAGAGTYRGVIQTIDDQGLARYSVEMGGADQKFKIYTNDGTTLQPSLRILSGVSPRTFEIVSSQNVILSGNAVYLRDTGEGSFYQHDGSNYSFVNKTGNTQFFSSNGAGGNALRLNYSSGVVQGSALITAYEPLALQKTIQSYNNITTAGLGVPGIYAASIQSPSNAAFTTVSYTPPATAGTYRMSAYLNITTGTTITFKQKVTYKDPTGTAVTDVPVWQRVDASQGIVALPTANTAARYSMVPHVFGIDNSATAITFADNAGTYTTCAYRLQVFLEQLN